MKNDSKEKIYDGNEVGFVKMSKIAFLFFFLCTFSLMKKYQKIKAVGLFATNQSSYLNCTNSLLSVAQTVRSF